MARPALSASRSVAVLNFLAAHPTEEFSLSDLAKRLDINVSSAHAVMNVLADAGYVVRHPRLRTYSLGPSVVALGSAALDRHPAIDHARDEARRLADKLDLAVSVTALAGDDIVFLARVGAHRPRGLAAYVGQRIPLVPPIGAVFAAWWDTEEWLARADDRHAMEAVLDEVRDRGWAVALDGTDDWAVGRLDPDRRYDVTMVAAPVFGPGGDPIVALTLLGLEPDLPAARLADYGEVVRDAGLVATRRSGGRAPRAV